LTGDPVVAALDDTTVDVLRLDDSLLTSGELLEGVELESCPEFESWLLVERRRISGEIEARLRQQAIGLLAGGQVAGAIPFAAKAVAVNPLEQGNHELLIRSLASRETGPARCGKSRCVRNCSGTNWGSR